MLNRLTSGSLRFCFLLAALLFTERHAHAVLGVDDDRSSLPEGPGSMNGFGDNADVGVATGAMTYSLPFEVPEGFASATPSLSLAYSSNGGNGPWGMGWNAATPSIERGTVFGLPTYTSSDMFFADGGEQLVNTDNTGLSYWEYRARFEGAFVRFRWHNVAMAAANADYWTAELPDGTIRYFGADSNGTPDAAARQQGATGTFKYELVASVDPFGNKIHYTWQEFAVVDLVNRAIESTSRPVLSSIEYAFKADAMPRHKIVFTYEQRPDTVSDCKPGFCVYLEHRTTLVDVYTNTTKIRSYAVAYDPMPMASPLSRLRGRKVTGKDGGVYPAASSFDYTQALGVGCAANDCGKPLLVTMAGATLGADVKAGAVSLVDINGDALPDGLYTDAGGVHHFFINKISGSTQSFVAKDSALAGITGFKLGGGGHTQLVDLDGDGFVDLVDLTQGKLLRNLGTGDWTAIENVTVGAGNAQVASQNLNATETSDGVFNDDDVVGGYMRFIDVDNDKRSDLIQASVGNAPIYYRNAGNGGFTAGVGLSAIVPSNNFGFDSNGTQLADMNGDGLQDAAWVVAGSPGVFKYVLNLGNGKFSATQVSVNLPSNILPTDTNHLSFEDLNGDDLNDIVLIIGNTLSYALNVNGTSFGSWQSISSIGGTALPDATQTALFADMNGNGSTDVVWFSTSGAVTYLDLFPQRPFLLSQVKNGLGKIIDVTYTTSVLEAAAATTPWTHRLLHANTMVSSLDDWDAQSNVHDVTKYHYANALYAGVDRQFRGFEIVQTETTGDPAQEDGLATQHYDLGDTDDYHHGLMLSSTETSAGRELQTVNNTFADCTVAGVPSSGLSFPVRHVCKSATEMIKKEGAAAAEWATMRTEYTYDGYGNTTKLARLGITSIGGAACGSCGAAGDYGKACGSDCSGDESYVDSTFVAPSAAMGGWLLGKPVSVRTYSDASSAIFGETLSFYDGAAFQGLPAGQLTKGRVTREQTLKEAGSYITTLRHRYDAHGNLIEEITPLGMPDGPSHRRISVYDADGLELVRQALLLDGYMLWRDYSYDPVFTHTASVSNWYAVTGGTVANGLISGGTAEGTVLTTSYTYDEFGRQTAIIAPGDDPATPSESYSYSIGSPVSVMTATGRSTRNGAVDTETIQCFDGHSRIYQERTRVDSGHYLVTGHTVFNVRKEPVRVYEPYTSTSAGCDTTEPTGVSSVSYMRDAAARQISMTRADASVYGSDSVMQLKYLPLARVDYDAEDSDDKSAHANTPTVRRFDGLGRVVAIERHLKAGDAAITHTITYDALGNFRGYVDPEGNRRTQDYDRMGDVLRIQDPIRGARTLAYDDDRNLTKETDGRGESTAYAYDGLDRQIESFHAGAEAASRVDYTYDRPGACDKAVCTNLGARLVGVTYPLDNAQHGTDYVGYDDRANLARLRRGFHGQTFDFTYAFDNLRRRTGTTYPNGKNVPYTLDAAGRLTAMGSYITKLGYDERGDVTSLVYGNGIKTSYEHDAIRQLKHVTVTDAANQAIVDLVSDRDREGHVTKVTDSVVDASHPSHGMEVAYDALYRVASATLDKDRGDFREDLAFTHSAAGNLTSKTSSLSDKSTAHVGSYAYDPSASHRLLSAGSYKLTYDAAGNTTSFKDGQALAWDYRGRLLDVTDASTTAHFEYGGSEARISKKENGSTTYYVSPDYEVRDGDAQIYMLVGDRQMAKIEYTDTASKLLTDIAPASLAGSVATPAPDGVITSGDAWIAQWASVSMGSVSGVTPSSVDELLAAAARKLLAGDGVENVTYYTHDSTGGFIAGTDGAGKTVAQMVQHPYGTRRWSRGGAPEDLRFGNKEVDASGMAFYGARYAHLPLGRWASPDPEFASITNLAAFDSPDQVSGPYLFLDGDPVNLTDDDGRFAHFIVGGAIGFAAGFASSLVGDLIVNPPAKFRGIGWKKQAAIVTRIIGSALFKGAINGVAGALTGGLSAISTISATATNVSVYKYKMRTFQERQNLYLHENNLERNDKNLEISRIHVVTDIRRSARRWALGVGLVTGIGTSFGAAAAVGAGAIHVDSMGIHVNVADAFAGTATSSAAGVAAQVGYGIAKEVNGKSARDKAVEEVRNPTPPKVKMMMSR